MNDSDIAQGTGLPETTTDDRGDATQILPPEILQHIFTFVEPILRKSVVALVCKRWKRLEATVPQHPSSIFYGKPQWQEFARLEHCDDSIWLARDEFVTSRLEKATILCPISSREAKEECSGCIRTLLTKLGAEPSPLTHLLLSDFQTQPEYSLLDSLARLRSLKKLEITSWYCTRSEIPRLAEFFNLQQLEDLELWGLDRLDPESEYEEDLRKGCAPIRQALQSLTALTNLAIGNADILCPVLKSRENFCTQIRCLQYHLWEPFPEEGLAYCLQNMPALSSLNISYSSVKEFLTALHHLQELVLNGRVSNSVVVSKEAKLPSLSIKAEEIDDIGDLLPLPTIIHLESLRINADYIGGEGLPAFWSQLTNLTHLYLPCCEFLPSSLATLPKLQSLAMHTCLGVYRLGPDNLLTLVQSLLAIVKFNVEYYVLNEDDEDIDEFTEEILRVQELLPDVSIRGHLIE